ncbi:MAG TPA: hypothetical protein DC024_10415 [Clostridiales bacterium]|jgi:hypothetical protein|nr:hypothetical protein [Clostridiales bacterium]
MSLEECRIAVCQNMNRVVPEKIRKKMKLVSDSVVGNRYRAAWISYDHQECIICQLADYTQPQCPVELVPFGFEI